MANWGGSDEEIDLDNHDDEDFESDEDESDDDDEDNDDDEVNNEIVHQFIRTFSNGDYDQEFDDALCSDRSAVVPNTRPTQASYNKPDNWRERNGIGLTKVKQQLQDCIDQLSYDNGFYLNLTHNGYGHQLMDNEEPIVWHEPILDEYWDQLKAKIDRKKQQDIVTEVEGITIMNIEMTKERLAALLAIFRNGSATNSSPCITLDNTNLCGEGIIYLSKLVEICSQLYDLTISHNRMDNMESARCLSRSLKSHTGINQLYLTHCELGSSPEILSVILQSDIRFINLDNNNIDSLGAAKIAEYLEDNPPIRRIDLDRNRLNDDDAILISQALKRNTNLKTINMHSNNLTSIGVKALLKCVFDVSSLNAISESNHNLERLVLFSHQTNESLVGGIDRGIDRLLELERTEKIVLALQDKDSLLKYLTNVPVELMPEVLAFPLRWVANEHQHEHLNIVYSTMRWWNMPMLYSYLNCVKSDAKRKRDD